MPTQLIWQSVTVVVIGATAFAAMQFHRPPASSSPATRPVFFRVDRPNPMLARPVLPIDVSDWNLKSVCGRLSQQTGVPIDGDWDHQVEIGTLGEFQLDRAVEAGTLEQTLDLMAGNTSGRHFAWQVRGDRIHLVPIADDLVTHVYDLASLFKTGKIQRYLAAHATTQPSTPADDTQDVQNLLETIDPYEWQDQGGDFNLLKFFDDQAIITARSRTHVKIAALLAAIERE